jgi:hypothetical protein
VIVEAWVFFLLLVIASTEMIGASVIGEAHW